MTGNANSAIVEIRFAQLETPGVFGQRPGVNAPVTMLATAVKEPSKQAINRAGIRLE